MDVKHYMQQLGRQAREASRATARASTAAKNTVLLAMAATIRERCESLLAANAADVAEAKANGFDAAMIDRLTLTKKGVEAMALGVEQVAALPDPIGEITDSTASASLVSATTRVPGDDASMVRLSWAWNSDVGSRPSAMVANGSL